jgi:hypothetical protein
MDKFNLLSRSALVALLAGLGSACQQPTATVGSQGAVAVASPLPAANGALPNAAAAAAPTQNPEDAMPRVRVEEAKNAMAAGKAIIIDVRGSEAYKTAHIKGSIDHPLARLEQGDFKDLPKDKRIIAYCS